MRQVWGQLVNCNLPFLTVHDEIIVRESDFQQAKEIIAGVLNKEFIYHKLHFKIKPLEVATLINDDSEDLSTPADVICPLPLTSHSKPLKKVFAPVRDIPELEIYFSNIELPCYPIRLNEFTIIKDVKKFIKNHLEIIKHNNGNPMFLPYFSRLQELKEVLN